MWYISPNEVDNEESLIIALTIYKRVQFSLYDKWSLTHEKILIILIRSEILDTLT